MALQGTLDDFGLDEVLAMLGTGGKQGRLRVSGPAGTGSMWVDHGRVVGSALGGDEVGSDHAETLFHLLRLNEGEFAFLPGEQPGRHVDIVEIHEVIACSNERIEEWREIEGVLPSLEHWLVLPSVIPAAATIEPSEWEIVACIGPGRRIATVVRALGKGLVPGSKDVVSLVQRGLISVTATTPPEVRQAGGRASDLDIDPQLPSVGAAHVPESHGADEAGFDLFGGEAVVADQESTAENGTGIEAERDVGPLPVAFHPERGPEPEATHEPQPQTETAPQPESDATPPAGPTDVDDTEVNPRALLRLLNSVR